MTVDVLVDTGPLVAILDRSYSHHTACVEALSLLRTPLVTTWPVLTEAAYLLRQRSDLVGRLMRSTSEGFLRIAVLREIDAIAMAEIMERYVDQHFQLADVSLMLLVDRDRIETVFTLDRRDFSVFRTRQGSHLRLIPEL
ncbi:MAG: hypothetical protein R3C17_03130 [Planctomycetaceae bacterium]